MEISTNDDDLRADLASTAIDKGASLVALEQGGSVQQAINFVMPEWFGAKGNGIDDDSVAFTLAAKTGKNISLRSDARYLISSPAVLAFVPGFIDGSRRDILGNGATIITTGPYEPFHQYSDETNTATTVIKYGWNYYALNFEGYTDKDGAWSIVNKSIGLSFGFGRAEKITGKGLCNVIRAYGKTLTRDIYGDNLRNALYSCYTYPDDNVTGENQLFNASIGWCSGDGLVLKGRNVQVDNFSYEYAGCITPQNADEISRKAAGKAGEPRGVAISIGADETQGGDIVITNVTGKYYGAGAFSFNGDNISLGGVLNVGSHYKENFIASLSGSVAWLNIQNSYIGFIHAKDVYSGFGINAGSESFRFEGISIRSKMAINGAVLCSATDSSTSSITRGSVGPVYLHGESTVNNDIYLNTAGIVFEGFYIAQMNNQQGGVSVEFAKACWVHKLDLIATTSAATNTWVRFSANARVDQYNSERAFGTALLVRDGAVPSLGSINLRNKLGNSAPIIIQGDGTAIHNWSTCTITGSTTGRPAISGSLIMEGYSGPTWKLAASGINGSVSYPDKTTKVLTE